MKDKCKNSFGPNIRNYIDCNGNGMAKIENYVEDPSPYTYDSECYDDYSDINKKDRKV